MNLYFLRDQSITTDRGVVIASMNSDQRSPEVELIKFIYDKLNIVPIYTVNGSGRMEGGDFIPAGEVSFMGQGLRTNPEAISQLFENKVFGAEKVVIVKDQWKNQSQMHLDTYFNIIAPNKAVLVENRLGDDSNMKLHADIYTKNSNDSYSLSSQNVDFVEFLTNDLGYQIIPVSAEDQLRYGINFLTIYENRILGIEGVSNGYKAALEQAGVNVTWMNFTNLICGYGAAHCTTQVIHRVPASKSKLCK